MGSHGRIQRTTNDCVPRAVRMRCNPGFQARDVNGPVGALDTPTFHANLPSDIEDLKPVRRFTLAKGHIQRHGCRTG